MNPEETAAWQEAIAAAKARANGWTVVETAEPEPPTDRPRDPSLPPKPEGAP